MVGNSGAAVLKYFNKSCLDIKRPRDYASHFSSTATLSYKKSLKRSLVDLTSFTRPKKSAKSSPEIATHSTHKSMTDSAEE